MQKWIAILTGCILSLTATAALAGEHSMGQPLVKDGMILHPVYLQPVHMAPSMPGMQGKTFDAHVEIDIHADKKNPYGFSPGAWIPYLQISYMITKQGSDWTRFGDLMPMVANDGPHYGQNVKFDGPGKYTFSFHILPPPYSAFYRHTDKETGVPAWWKPFSHSWTFAYTGSGKKGGY